MRHEQVGELESRRCESSSRSPLTAIMWPMDHVRIDKWLWAARFFKSRSTATDAVLGGRVQLNGTRVKPAREVRVADTLEIRRGPTQWTVVVAGLADRRGSAEVAAGLYEETPESVAAREQGALARRLARPPGADLVGRPTKQDRRRLDALRCAKRER